jgi:hypothetical protein
LPDMRAATSRSRRLSLPSLPADWRRIGDGSRLCAVELPLGVETRERWEHKAGSAEATRLDCRS